MRARRYAGGRDTRVARHMVVNALLTGFLGAACDVGSESDPQTIARDSAGIAIITSTEPIWTTEPAWQIDSVPAMTLGVADGPEEYLFSRLSRSVRLEDGTFVLADAQARVIRFYDSTGKHLHSVGGRGGGPGEFLNISLLERYGSDSLVVWDSGMGRATIMRVTIYLANHGPH